MHPLADHMTRPRGASADAAAAAPKRLQPAKPLRRAGSDAALDASVRVNVIEYSMMSQLADKGRRKPPLWLSHGQPPVGRDARKELSQRKRLEVNDEMSTPDELT